MVDFRYWFECVVSTCQLIASDALFRVWVRGQVGITSIYSPDELFEQLLGDLHLDHYIEEFKSILSEAAAFDAVAEFVRTLHWVEDSRKARPELTGPEALLGSTQWAALKQTANRIVELPFAEGYRTRSSAGEPLAEGGGDAN